MMSGGGGVKSHASEIETLRDRVQQLEDALGIGMAWPLEWHLPPSVATVLSVLVARPVATKNACMTALYADRVDPPTEKCVDTFVCRLRSDLKRRHGISINTRRGVGWFLNADDRARLRKIAERVRQEA